LSFDACGVISPLMSKSRAMRLASADESMNALPAFRCSALEFAAGVADNENRLGAVADRLGKIAAKKAELVAYEDKLKAVIIDAGEDAVEGKIFRATLSIFDQVRLDTAAIREEFDEKTIAKYELVQKVKQVRVKARTGALADAA
jgi:hypothetical protein